MGQMDEAAFTAFYREHVHDVLAYLERRTGSAELAADLTAEVFATVLLRSGRYDPARGDGRAWLFAIARHKQVDAYRRGAVERSAQRRLGMQAVEATEDDLALIEGLGTGVTALVSELPADQRDAVQGRFVEDLEYEELARRQRVSQAAVRQRVSRGLVAIRTRMENQ